MSEIPASHIRLTPVQEKAILALIQKLHDRVKIGDGWAKDGHLPDWETSNLFGIFGPRGAGKSTLLNAFVDLAQWAWQTRGIRENSRSHSGQGVEIVQAMAALSKDACVVNLIDCSSLPDEVVPGAATLLRLRDDAAALWKNFEHKAHIKENLQARLHELAGAHTRIDSSYRELCLELSSTPDEFPDHVMKGIESRFTLRYDLARWLNDATRELAGQDPRATGDVPAKAFIVLLDDFDLVVSSLVRRWLRSLLDELHQCRLIFVLAADYHRLEHLSYGGMEGFDDLTGRSLLEKILPPPNRISLEPWAYPSRLQFRPGNAEKDLGSLLQQQLPQGLQPYLPLFHALLPNLPRGLLSLYRSLEQQATSPTGANSTQPDAKALETKEFLSLLASCRSESLLARQLKEVDPTTWIYKLSWTLSHESIGPQRSPRTTADTGRVEDWRDMVRHAIPRQDATLPPLLLLAPPRAETELPKFRDALTHDPHWTDPLRHDEYRIDQLRDAQPNERALWVELLLELGMGTPDHRTRFLWSWPPTRMRLSRMRFQVTFPVDRVVRFFEQTDHEIRDLLPWLAWRPKESKQDEVALDIGWLPLFHALRGARDPWPARLLHELMVGPDMLQGKLPQPGDNSLALLPRRVRALVLLVDALHRCPWQAFSYQRLGWDVLTYVRWAGALVGISYLRALCEVDPGLKDNLTDPRYMELLQQLERFDPILVNARQEMDSGFETRVFQALEAMALDSFLKMLTARPAAQSDPLYQAALAFFNAPVYRKLTPRSSAKGGS